MVKDCFGRDCVESRCPMCGGNGSVVLGNAAQFPIMKESCPVCKGQGTVLILGPESELDGSDGDVAQRIEQEVSNL